LNAVAWRREVQRFWAGLVHSGGGGCALRCWRAQWMGLDNTRFVAICNLVMEEILGNMWYSHLTWGAE